MPIPLSFITTQHRCLLAHLCILLIVIRILLSGNPVYTFDTGTYYFQKETVTWADIQWNDIGTKEIHAYYNMEINIYGSSEGVVYNSENLAVP